MKPKFSVAVIARNESETLPRLVNSLKEFQRMGGEILVLDTGSTDNTIEVAKGLGCIVYPVGNMFLRQIDNADDINKFFITNNELPIVKNGDTLFDFASARNYIAEKCSNDIIAMPDCDEIFTKFNIQKLNEVIEQGTQQLEYNFVYSHDKFGNEVIKFLHSKFYDRRVLKWVGIIHEVLHGDAKRQFLDESFIKLEHFQNPKTNRGGYLKGLALDCFLNKSNDRNSHYLARELMWTGRYRSAIKEFERHISMNGWVPEKAQSYIFIGDCYLYLNDYTKAFDYYNKAIFVDGSRREAYIKIARLFKYLNNPTMVKVYALTAMNIPWHPFYANDMSHYTNEPHELLYWAYGWLGDIENAKHHIMKAWEYKPGNETYLRDINFYFGLPFVSIIIPNLGRPDGLLKCLESIDKLDYPKELIQTIIINGEETVPNKVAKGLKQALGEYIVYAANDMEFYPDSLKKAIQEGKQYNKRLIAFDSGVRNDKGYICEHFIIKKDLIPVIGGQIFDTDFFHVGVDDLLWAKCTKLNESMVSSAKILHNHFSRIGSGIEPDEVNHRAFAHVESDRKLLELKLSKV
jgi:glycosyltransferase involved in cell wall biosynthesis